MARGTKAKEEVARKLKEAFGANYLGEKDRKHYVLAREDGEQIQIAISLTCPKAQVTMTTVNTSGDLNFEEMTPVLSSSGFEPAEYTDEEREIIERLKKLV